MKRKQVNVCKTMYLLVGLFLCLAMLGAAAPAQAQGTSYAYVSNGGLSSVFGFTINPDTGELTAIPGSPFPTNGLSSREVTVDPTGQFVYVANAGVTLPFGGSVPASISAFRRNLATGALALIAPPYRIGDSPLSAEGAQSVIVDPSGQFVYVAAAAGRIYAYTINPASGALTPIPGQPFQSPLSGPFSVTIDPTGSFAYVANRGGGLFGQGGITAYTINPDTGALAPIPGSPYAVGLAPYAVTLDWTGQFLYAANSVGPPGNVLAFRVDGITGALTPVPGSPFPAGNNPQGITVGGINGEFVYVTNRGALFVLSNTVSAYRINPATGALTQVPGSPFAVGPVGSGPTSATTDPSGSFLYVTTWADNSVRVFNIDLDTGAITLAGGPYVVGIGPWWVTTTAGPPPPSSSISENQ